MSRSHQLVKRPLQKIAIVRALPGLGDLLCAVPALRALRTAFPQAQIALVGLPCAKVFVERFHLYVDEWLEFPGYPGIPEGWRSPQPLLPFLMEVHKQSFDLAIQMHGSGIISNSFTVLLGAKLNAGFFVPGQYCPDPDHFLPYPEGAEVRRHLRLMEFLGIPLQGEELEFPLYETDWLAFKQIAESQSLPPGKYICVHPGARVLNRRWSPLQFACIADVLSAMGYQIVLTGTATERDLAQTVIKMMKSPAVNLAGLTSLGTLGALLQEAALLICNDTGISHLAAALKVKSVVIFSNSDPLRWAPLDHQRHRAVGFKTGRRGDGETGRLLEAVLTQAKELLQEAAYA